LNSVLLSRIERVLAAASAACLFVLMLIVLIDVVGRNLFNAPLPWATELLEILVAAVVFLFYPILGLRAGHITVDLITVGPAVQRAQRLLGAIMGVLLFCLISWCMGRQAIRAAGYGEASPLLGIPLDMVLGGMSILAILTALGFLTAFVRAFRASRVLAREAILVPRRVG
jgi:TRAP-type C4-dicarboxylate transport system permease small subunit